MNKTYHIRNSCKRWTADDLYERFGPNSQMTKKEFTEYLESKHQLYYAGIAIEQILAGGEK